MKLALAFAAMMAVASAQFSSFGLSGRAPSVAPPRPSAPVASRVSNSDQNANVLRYDNDGSPDGSFKYVVETDNGIAVQAEGTPRDFGGSPPVVPVVITGSYSYTSPEGKPVVITYTADENGFQAYGDVIPTSPPIPEAILRSLNQKK